MMFSFINIDSLLMKIIINAMVFFGVYSLILFINRDPLVIQLYKEIKAKYVKQ